MFIIHSVRKTTLSLAFRLEKAFCQLIVSMALLIAWTLALGASQIRRSYTGGKKILKSTLANISWWWHLGNKEGRTPESAIKSVADVNNKFMQDAEFGSIWVGSSMIWCKPFWEAKSSISLPWEFVISSAHQSEFLALKSPVIRDKLVSSHFC